MRRNFERGGVAGLKRVLHSRPARRDSVRAGAQAGVFAAAFGMSEGVRRQRGIIRPGVLL